MARIPFPGSALLAHQTAHLDAILNGELQPVKVPELLPPKIRHFLDIARHTNFQPYAINMIAGEHNLFIMLLPEEQQRPADPSLDLAVGLFGETYEKGMPLFDFYLASKGEGNDVHIWQREALKYLKPRFEQKQVRPIRAADTAMRTAEADALQENRLQDYLAHQLRRLEGFAELMGKGARSGKTGMALMSLHHGCNPALFDRLDVRGTSYVAVVPSYRHAMPWQRASMPTQCTYTTVLYGTDWLFASWHLGRIQQMLAGHGVIGEPITTAYHGQREAGYARINHTIQTYALSDAGTVTVELLHMRSEKDDKTTRKSVLTVSAPNHRRDLAEALGRYVHGI